MRASNVGLALLVVVVAPVSATVPDYITDATNRALGGRQLTSPQELLQFAMDTSMRMFERGMYTNA